MTMPKTGDSYFILLYQILFLCLFCFIFVFCFFKANGQLIYLFLILFIPWLISQVFLLFTSWNMGIASFKFINLFRAEFGKFDDFI